MRHLPSLLFASFAFPFVCYAQQTSPALPDAPSATTVQTVGPNYMPPTQGERFKAYLRVSYGPGSIVEAAARGGIDQARDRPSGWPQGAEGYGDRFGSAMGEIAVRETTEYVVADIFREDIRYIRCPRPCEESKLKLAFEDSFLARKGEDGHEAFSIARVAGPISGQLVAVNTWYPAGNNTRAESAQGIVLTYGFVYVRNLIHEFIPH